MSKEDNVKKPREEPWVPPIGIPVPKFGLTEQAPAVPDPWTTETPGFYYVEKSGAGASDSRTYGHPGAPRATIPLSIPEGSVVEVHGPYVYSHGSPRNILAKGTVEKPVFIRGFDSNVGRQLAIRGTYYIVENLTWSLAPSSDAKPPCFKIQSPTNWGVLRNSKLGGNLTGGGIQVGSSSSTGGEVMNVVLLGNDIHDSGDVASPEDQDIHSVAIGSKVSNLWLVDNEIHDSSGSGTQVNAGSATGQALTHHIYLGRNHVYRTRQAGLFAKQSTDVIVSQNTIHDIINTSWSPSKGLGFQYAPERLWFLFNEVHHCTYGIYSGSDSGMGTGRTSYMIGNVIHDIHRIGGTYNANSAWAHAGIMLAGGIERHIVANTIYDCDGGIYCPSSAGSVALVNNIVSKISEPGGTHVFIEFGSVAQASIMDNNLFADTARLKWGGNTIRSLSEYQALHTTKGTGCIEGDPLFVDPAGANFDLGTGSPAILAGVLADVYATFETLYGINIQVDKNSQKRPFGSAWDIGAYEAQVISDPCAELRLENEALKRRIDELTAENATLKAESETLKSQNETLQQENTTLKQENVTLQQRIDAAIKALSEPVPPPTRSAFPRG
jgi:FtsZ-binding cell division protein ZapB